MNILFFSRLFYPHIGGVEKHIFFISQELIRQGHTVTVVTEKHDRGLKQKEIYKKINIFRIPIKHTGWFKKIDIWYWLYNHRKLINTSDIVHCHDVFFWYFPFRFIFFKKKVYTTFHGYESYPISKRAIVVRKVSELLSSGNICVGSFIKKWYGTNPTRITYGGAQTSYEHKNVKDNSAVFIGRLDDQTGITDYIKAVKEIQKIISNFKFLIVGDGDYRKRIEKDFKVKGFKKNPEKYYQNIKFAFVSRYLSILEAMNAKKLVFALYDNPIKKDYLKMTPFSKFIIIEKDPVLLAKKVIYFLNHPKAENRLIEKAYQWSKNQTWYAVANMYLRLYEKNN